MEQHRHRLLSLLLLLVWPPVFLAPRAQPEEIPKVDLSKLSLEDCTSDCKSGDLLPSLPFESRRALAEREILQPSPIQALALPHIGSGKHAVLVSETGSGKTLAYLLPAVERAREADEERRKSTGPSSVMILTPTRELAVQILAEKSDQVKSLLASLQGIIALVTLSARASWYTLMDASVIIGTPADILDVFDEEDAEEVKDLLGRIEVIILDELDELLPKNKFTGRRLARYQDPGMWPAEGLLKRLMRSELPDGEGIQHFSWKVPLSGSHAAAVAAALEKLRPESALIFVCPNAEETVKSVVKDLATAGWSNVDALSRMLFPDSRNTAPGKKASQAKGEAKGWRSANRLVDLRDTTRRGYSTEGDFYREAPIFVSAEDMAPLFGTRSLLCGDALMTMGAKPCICVLRAEVDCPPTGDRWSCCGSDAFYRDEFLEEEAVTNEGLTGKLFEQAVLKSMKGQVFLDYTKFSAVQAATAFKRRMSGDFPEPQERHEPCRRGSKGSYAACPIQ
eukprot:g29442.t1